jgi:hypothetical protein
MITGHCDACGARLQRLRKDAPVLQVRNGHLHRHPYPWQFIPDK